MSFVKSVSTVLTAAAVIFALRVLPFLAMARADGDRKWLKLAEKWLAPVIIAFLVVYTYSTLEWRSWCPYAAGLLVVVLQLVWRNGLVSIFAGTALYMFLIA